MNETSLLALMADGSQAACLVTHTFHYKSEFASSQYSWFDQGFLGKTVKVKAASGWRVKALYVYTWDSTNRNGSLKKIKNGAKIPKQNVLDVTAVMQNKKSKGTICLSFGTM